MAGTPRLSVRAFLTIDVVGLDPAGSPRFSLSGPPVPQLAIAPGSSVSITVRFDPIANGSARGAVVVRSTVAGQGAVVNLSAQGTTISAGMVAILLNSLGLADAPAVFA